LITVTGEEGKRIEEQTDHETKTEIMKTLRKMYGEKIPDPTGTYVSSARNAKFPEPLFFTSYLIGS